MSGLSKKNLRIPKTIKLFIGGEFPRTESGRTLPAYTEDGKTLYAHLCRASRKDLRNAVTAAQSAQEAWARRSAYNRGQILYRMAEMAESKRAEFIETLTVTAGLSEKQAEEQLDLAIDAFLYYAGFSDKFQQMIGAVNPVAGPHHCFTTSEPVGVVALVFDATTDFSRAVSELSAIISSGNSLVVLLPEKIAAVLAPLAEVFATSDLPKGVVNLLTGELSELSKHFATHMEIQCLSYQGTDEALLTEYKSSGANNMKRIVRSSTEPLALETLLNYVEYKTVWHPIGY